MLEEEVAGNEVGFPRQVGNEGFGSVAAGRAVEQVPVGRVVGKALAGAARTAV